MRLCPLTTVALSVAGSAVIVEFTELGGGEAGSGDTGGAEGGDTGAGGGGVTEADRDGAAGGGGDAGGGKVGGGEVVPACVTLTMRGTVISFDLPDPESQMYTRPEFGPTFMAAELIVTLTVSSSVVMVLLLP